MRGHLDFACVDRGTSQCDKNHSFEVWPNGFASGRGGGEDRLSATDLRSVPRVHPGLEARLDSLEERSP